MGAPRPWADLPTDVLASVIDRLTLKGYLAARCVCKSWRSRLPPQPLCMVVDGVHQTNSAAFSISEPVFRVLLTLPEGSRCIGACNGWVAVAYTKAADRFYKHRKENKGREGKEPILIDQEGRLYSGRTRQPFFFRNFFQAGEPIQQVNANARKFEYDWFISLFNPVTGRQIDLPPHERLQLQPRTVYKAVFAPNPTKDDFTVVVAFGWNSFAYISTRDDDDEAWSFGEIPERTFGEALHADMVYREDQDAGDRVYYLARSGNVHVLHVPRGRPMNLVVQPLVPEDAGAFPPPYDSLARMLTGAKNLAFCDGNLYQIWRNHIGVTIRLQVPGDDDRRLTVRKDDVFVLRFDYDSSRQTCWTVVEDLGGHAVFVGPANSAVTVRPEGVPGLEGDCVYWVGRVFENGGTNVFDMRNKRTTPCLSPPADCGVPVCWCTPGDNGSSSRIASG